MIDISLESNAGIKFVVVLIPQQRIDGHGESPGGENAEKSLNGLDCGAGVVRVGVRGEDILELVDEARKLGFFFVLLFVFPLVFSEVLACHPS